MKICLDPGHGGYDSGAVGNGLREKDITLKIVLAMRDILVAQGHQVILTRDSDSSPKGITDTSAELMARCDIANQAAVDLFVSIHINSFSDSSASGAEVYYYSAAGQGLALRCQKAQLAVMGNADRGIKTANYAVIKYTNNSKPSVLCESGFISNVNDANKYKCDNIIQALAKGYCEAILNTKIETTPVYTQKQPVVCMDPTTKQLQSDLNSLFNCNLAVDGIPGPCTESAKDKVKQILGVTSDNELLVAISQIKSRPTLARNCSYKYGVKYLQWRLGITIDGIFGYGTLVTVQNYQSRNGLSADGVVGPMTWSRLMR